MCKKKSKLNDISNLSKAQEEKQESSQAQKNSNPKTH